MKKSNVIGMTVGIVLAIVAVSLIGWYAVKPVPTLIQGEVVSPINLPDECRFCKRCPQSGDECRRGIPALREVSPGHFVACGKCQ